MNHRCQMIHPHHPDCECEMCELSLDEECARLAVGTVADSGTRVCADCAALMERETFAVRYDMIPVKASEVRWDKLYTPYSPLIVTNVFENLPAAQELTETIANQIYQERKELDMPLVYSMSLPTPGGLTGDGSESRYYIWFNANPAGRLGWIIAGDDHGYDSFDTALADAVKRFTPQGQKQAVIRQDRVPAGECTPMLSGESVFDVYAARMSKTAKSPWNTKCPLCSKDALLLFNMTECSNTTCQNYVKPK